MVGGEGRVISTQTEHAGPRENLEEGMQLRGGSTSPTCRGLHPQATCRGTEGVEGCGGAVGHQKCLLRGSAHTSAFFVLQEQAPHRLLRTAAGTAWQ
jgi:hypothetical protein